MRGATHRLLLIHPPFHRLFKPEYGLNRFPIGLGYLAGVVAAQTDWSVRVYGADVVAHPEPFDHRFLSGTGDANFVAALDDPTLPIWREVRRVVENERPSVVGVSAMTPSFASAARVAAIARDVDPGIIVVLGGPHTAVLDDPLRDGPFDIAVVGEGEVTLVELLGALADGRRLDAVAGLVYRDAGTVRRTVRREPIADLSSLPWPHLCVDEALVARDRYPVTHFRSMMTSRGCPFACTFCGSHRLWGRRLRQRDVGDVAAEAAALRRLGVRFVDFDDDTFGVDRAHTEALCGALAANAGAVRWSCETRCELVDASVARLYAENGCHLVYLGVESGSDRVLDEIGKSCTIAQATATAALLRTQGLQVTAYFMLGLPDETEADMELTLAAMRTFPCDTLAFSVFSPYPGTEAYESLLDAGRLGDGDEWGARHHQRIGAAATAHVGERRLRELIGEAESIADRRNAAARRHRLLRRSTLDRVRELGVVGSIRRANRLLRERKSP